MSEEREQAPDTAAAGVGTATTVEACDGGSERPREIGGPKGPEPTRFGDWERAGRCIDF